MKFASCNITNKTSEIYINLTVHFYKTNKQHERKRFFFCMTTVRYELNSRRFDQLLSATADTSVVPDC